MQRGVREEAQYICLAMDEYGDSFLTKKASDSIIKSCDSHP